MPLKEFVGAAPPTRLASTLAVGTTTSFTVITSGGNGYPSGATAPFVVVIDRGTATEEKILVTSRASDVFSGLSRGYDGTTAQAHSSQAVVEHVLDAATVTEANAHVNTTARDDHTQYLNTARHAAVAHTGAMIQDLSVGTADLADLAVTTAKINDGAVTSAKILDGTIVLADLAAALQDFLVPTGSIVATGRATAPSAAWLICDGAAVSRATYSALFTAIGTTYGAGDGSSTFNLPDFRQRVPMGKAASGTGSTLGGTGGSKDNTLVQHTHVQNAHTHSGTSADQNQGHTHASNGSNAPHDHSVDGDYGTRLIISHGAGVDKLGSSPTGGTGTPVTVSTIDSNSGAHDHGTSQAGNQGHTHTLTTGTQSNTGMDSPGVSATDANLQPYQVVNYIIKV